MRAKIKHRRAASPRRPGIARLRKQAILFRKFVDRTLKKALRAAPGAVPPGETWLSDRVDMLMRNRRIRRGPPLGSTE